MTRDKQCMHHRSTPNCIEKLLQAAGKLSMYMESFCIQLQASYSKGKGGVKNNNCGTKGIRTGITACWHTTESRAVYATL